MWDKLDQLIAHWVSYYWIESSNHSGVAFFLRQEKPFTLLHSGENQAYESFVFVREKSCMHSLSAVPTFAVGRGGKIII